ncbi:MAG: DUF1292 domain-containing protein [Lachnospiraceae bacterium]|nr:DUF1292 domain-containing protein [Lachnospiraceae bacterium]
MIRKRDEDEGFIEVELDLDDGSTVTCDYITKLEVEGRSFIALTPRLEGSDDDEDQDVWFYGLEGDLEDMDHEPELIYIEDDETYEKVIDAFDEFLDEQEFEELMDETDRE